MKLEPGQVLIMEEDIEPAAREAIQPILDECDEVREQARQLSSQMDMLKAKAEYLNKLKWSLFDKFHPKTIPSLFEKDGDHIIRQYDWEGNKIAVLTKECDHSTIELNGIGLGDLLGALFKNRKEPKDKGPQAPESASTPPGAPAGAPMANPA